MLSMVRAVYWFEESLEAALAVHGIQLTRAESFVVTNMVMGIRRAINISRNLGVSRQAIAQIIAALESRGYVMQVPDPLDPRARVLNFSKTFEKHAPLCNMLMRASERELEQRVGKSAVQALRAALRIDWGPVPTTLLPDAAGARARSPNTKVGRHARMRARDAIRHALKQ